MGIAGLDHVQVAAPAGCEAAARYFYGSLLELSEVEKPEPLRARGGAWFQLGVRVSDGSSLEILADRLGAAGFPVIWDDTLDDARRFYSEDPWGNRIELLAGA